MHVDFGVRKYQKMRNTLSFFSSALISTSLFYSNDVLCLLVVLKETPKKKNSIINNPNIPSKA